MVVLKAAYHTLRDVANSYHHKEERHYIITNDDRAHPSWILCPLSDGDIAFHLDAHGMTFETIRNMCPKHFEFVPHIVYTIQTTWIPKNIYQMNEELKHKINILEELVDRPDGAGCKFGYDQIAKVLNS